MRGPANSPGQGKVPLNVIPDLPVSKIEGRLDASQLPTDPHFHSMNVGQLKIGYTSAPCNSQIQGMMRYNPGAQAMDFCDGSQWRRLAKKRRYVNCRPGFIGVPGNAFYSTDDFCVMKYEAKQDPTDNTKAISQASARPWVNVNRAEAQAACQASGFELLSNNHWQTIARNIELVPENWANNQIGDVGGLSRGHSDGTPYSALEASSNDTEGCFGTGQENTCDDAGRSQKRTHTVNNHGRNEVIWDMAGNVEEWVSDDRPPNNPGGLQFIAELTGARKDRFGPSGDYSATLGSPDYGNLGRFWQSGASAGGVLRGGRWSYHRNAGVFAASLSSGPSARNTPLGFRCFYSP